MDQGNSAILDKISQNLERFLEYNQTKKKNLCDSIGDPQVVFLLDLIPFLLATNYHSVPGHVSGQGVPTGIKDYVPTSGVIDFIRSKFPDSQVLSVQSTKPFVQMLALMGSGGTIAYTSESDFDFWICYHEEHYEAEQIDLFRKKCRDIEHWIYDHYKREVHFYLNEISKVRKNIFADDDENLAGASIGELLKEEFFRSSIVFQGGIPFWWMVPVENGEAAYGQWLQAAIAGGQGERFIDLGDLKVIRQEDFLPAALFQILKSLGSPFKSIIKLGLLERYLYSGVSDPFISTTVKRNIHEGHIDSEKIDAYVIMFNQVYEYYSSAGSEADVLEILKMSFYLKVEPKLYAFMKEGGQKTPGEKIRIMMSYVGDWGWSEKRIRQLDDFLNWGIDSVNKLLNNTKKFVLNGYKKILGTMETQKVKHRFTPQDLQAITRKIYSHFLVSENKVDNTLSFKSYPAEKLLKIEYVREKNGRDFWILSKRLIINDNPATIIIYKEKSLFGLSIWVSLNGLFLKDYTRLEIDAGLHTADPNAIRELIAEASSHFSFKKVELHNHYFLKDPFPIMSFIVFNPYSKYAKTLEEIFFLYHNSWGETKFEVFKSPLDLPKILTRILNGCITTRYDYQDAVNVVSLSPYRSSKEFHSFRQLVRDLYGFFMDQRPDVIKRFITSFANQYAVLQTKRRGNATYIELSFTENETKLFYALSFNMGIRNSIRLDPAVTDIAYFNAILGNCKEGVVQIYFLESRKFGYYFVVDEQGSVNFFRKDAGVFFEYLANLYVFAMDAVMQVTVNNRKSSLAGGKKTVEIYQIKKDETGAIKLMELNPELSSRISELRRKIAPLAVELSVDARNLIQYRFSVGDGGFSQFFPRENAGSMAVALRGAIQTIKGMPHFITGISVAGLPNKIYRNYTSFLFSEKNRLELIIERTMTAKPAPPKH
jgi:adenylate cyclase, class 1